MKIEIEKNKEWKANDGRDFMITDSGLLYCRDKIGGDKMLENICKELDVNIGEKWTANNGGVYRIDADGTLYQYIDSIDSWCKKDERAYQALLTGELKPVWRPKSGEYYYTPDFSESEMYYSYTWSNGAGENRLLNHNLIFRTKEEAIECANKML